jgi:hypothetical protein
MSDKSSVSAAEEVSQSNSAADASLVTLLDRLGIAVAHFAGRRTSDLKGFLSEPERVASLAVVCPAVLDTRSLALVRERLLVITGDRAPGARRVQAGLSDLPLATTAVVEDYAGLTWSDIAPAEGENAVGSARPRDETMPPSSSTCRAAAGRRKMSCRRNSARQTQRTVAQYLLHCDP